MQRRRSPARCCRSMEAGPRIERAKAQDRQRRKRRGAAVVKMAGEGLELPGQAVLVLQGGGALGAYQVGVFQAMHEAGIEPDWVIGTSIGAINGAIIAGNPPAERMRRLDAFWDHVRNGAEIELPRLWPGLDHVFTTFATVTQGIP